MAKLDRVRFNRRLISHIQEDDFNEAIKFLDHNVIKRRDRFGTLLHYAASHGNTAIARRLINMGSDINALGTNNKTPLMLAVERGHISTAAVLLRAYANIELTNTRGMNILQIIFERKVLGVLPLIMKKLRTEIVDDEGLAAKLTSLGCNLYHAVYFHDFDVMKSMLKYGIDVNARGNQNRTALHAAVAKSDFNLTKWLVENGADVNAVDADEENALLFIDTRNKNSTVLLKFLLEKGTNPNAKTCVTENTILFDFVSIWAFPTTEARVNECIGLLLEYDAIPHNRPDKSFTIFDRALISESLGRADLLIAHVALLQKIGTSFDKRLVSCNLHEHQAKFQKLTDYYKLCEQTLDIIVFRNVSLLALLTDDEFKIKTYVRNEYVMPKIEELCSNHEIEKLYPYYFNRLKKRIIKAVDLVELENTAFSILTGFFNGTDNKYYIPSWKVIKYLDKYDLEQLVQVQSVRSTQ